jgi:peptidyl-tRNA hydrolase, PTH1 family
VLAVFGLGNPGRRYESTRHNAGFDVVDKLADGLGETFSRRMRFRAATAECRAATAEGRVGDDKLLLVKPLTFMNDSGYTVQAVGAWHDLEPDQILVVCDDLDLELARIRVRRKGSSGGHKGLKSIAQALGTTDFPRLRIGIGRPPGQQDAVDYVLDRFSSAQRKLMDDATAIAAQAATCWVEDGIDRCMNRFNREDKT